MSKLGDTLQEAREARGLSLVEAERDTKIRAKYLAALEDDNLASLPGPVYARGFVRNYAQYLELDPEQALELFDEQSQPTRNKIKARRGERPVDKHGTGTETISIHPLSPEPVDTRVRYGSSYIAVSLLAIPLIILFYFIYSVWGVNRSANVPIPTPRPPTLTPMPLPTGIVAGGGLGAFNTPTVAVAMPPGNPGAPVTPTTLSGVQPSPTLPPSSAVVVKVVTTRDAWMRVLVDGVQQFSGTLPTGATRQWTGKQKVRIRTGRADAVKVTVNGVDRGTMQIGNDLIIEKEWDRQNNERVIP